MSRLLAIDPGSSKSALVAMDMDSREIIGCNKIDNMEFLEMLRKGLPRLQDISHVAIETLNPRGMPVSIESMETQFWAGRFVEASGCTHTKIDRKEVKMFICGRTNATDANIRRAIIDAYGGDDVAIGGVNCKKCSGSKAVGRVKARQVCPECNGLGLRSPRGPLYSVKEDIWSALAVALTYLRMEAKFLKMVN